MPVDVLHVIQSLEVGGAERVAATLAKSMPRDLRTGVLTIYGRGVLGQQLLEEGIPVWDLGLSPRASLMSVVIRISIEVRRIRPSLVHTHNQVGKYHGRLAAVLAGVKYLVHTEHNVVRTLSTRARCLNSLLDRKTDSIVAVSGMVRESVERLQGVKPSRICVIRNGVDLSLFDGRPNDRAGELGIPNDSFVVLTVGRLTEQKNQGLLLQAIRRLVPRVPSIVCVILGEGELRAYLEHLVREMGLDRHVFLLGHRADVRLWYGSAHVFVLTSLWEGLPLAVLEALASGLPVVSTRVSGVEEVVTDGIEGYLVESCPDAIAQRIEQLFLDSAMREIMGARARKKALMYSESEMCRRYYELYRRLLYEG